MLTTTKKIAKIYNCNRSCVSFKEIDLTRKLSESYDMQEKLAADNADLEVKRFIRILILSSSEGQGNVTSDSNRTMEDFMYLAWQCNKLELFFGVGVLRNVTCLKTSGRVL